MKKIALEGKTIGEGNPVLIIAEAGVNHNGQLDLALQLVDIAAEAGADVVKFQTFKAEQEVTKEAAMADYQVENTGKKESQLEMLRRLEFKDSFYGPVINRCKEKGIIFMSTPHGHIESADELERYNVSSYKIASGDLTNLPLLRHVARFKKPMFVATGMGTMEEARQAIETIKAEGNDQIVILHSTSNYPPSAASLNLKVLTSMQKELSDLDVLVGYSDNGSKGMIADSVAVALGSRVVEKHFTIDKNLEGPDHIASLSPEELKELVETIRTTEVMLGDGIKRCMPEEEGIKAVARKCLVSKRPIPQGTRITEDDLTIKRPGTGISPVLFDQYLGKTASQDIPEDIVLTEAMFL